MPKFLRRGFARVFAKHVLENLHLGQTVADKQHGLLAEEIMEEGVGVGVTIVVDVVPCERSCKTDQVCGGFVM